MKPGLDTTHIPDGIPVVVACSGGGDSVALLHLLMHEAPARGWRPVAAHLDHAIRADSAEDARWVRALCRDLGVPLLERRVEIAPLKRGGESLEAAARRVRYAFLAAVRSLLGDMTVVLTAHTADDQAETLAMRLERRAGLRGLRGVLPARRDGIVRPLLAVRGTRLREWARQEGLSWREDPTNRDTRFQRNRVRRRIASLPTPRADDLVAAAGVVAHGAVRLYACLERMAAGCVHLPTARPQEGPGDHSGPHLEGEVLLERPPGGFGYPPLAGAALDGVLAAVGARRAGVPLRARSRLLAWLDRAVPDDGIGRLLQLQPDLWAETVERGLLFARGADPSWSRGAPGDLGEVAVWLPEEPEGSRRMYHLPRGGILEVREADRRELEEAASGRLPATVDGVWSALLDHDAAPGGWLVRYAHRGDRMQPFGMVGRKTVKELMREARVPRLRRGRLPLIDSSDGILWVAAVRAGERGRVTRNARGALVVTFHPAERVPSEGRSDRFMMSRR